MAETLRVAVRTLHVLGMALLLGGAAALWYAGQSGLPDLGRHARRYEWAFWAAFGVMVITGVGNLGSLGAPGPETRWGSILLIKLVLVVGFVLGSAVRTLAVAQMDADRDRIGPDDSGRNDRDSDGFVRRAYGATTVTVFALVVLAEVLAHG